ncbi:predicted protein [Chaetoceros tenuissimus]|uniref:Uncharacterized protein n=1 Tax=Chaetoceros tenuissimus TaxID=426638 RepID=A0AAD3H1G9_9STRA|nr:predicted protein [Chaetoceros tenuissimus]
MNINKYRQSRINVPPKGVDTEHERFNRIELDRIRRQPRQNKEERIDENHNATTRQEHQQITRIDSSSTASHSGRSLHTAKEQELITMVERILEELLSTIKDGSEDDSYEQE